MRDYCSHLATWSSGTSVPSGFWCIMVVRKGWEPWFATLPRIPGFRQWRDKQDQGKKSSGHFYQFNSSTVESKWDVTPHLGCPRGTNKHNVHDAYRRRSCLFATGSGAQESTISRTEGSTAASDAHVVPILMHVRNAENKTAH